MAIIENRGGISRCSRGAVHPDDVVLRASEQAEGVVGSQVVLGGEGQAPDVVNGLEIFGLEANVGEYL